MTVKCPVCLIRQSWKTARFDLVSKFKHTMKQDQVSSCFTNLHSCSRGILSTTMLFTSKPQDLPLLIMWASLSPNVWQAGPHSLGSLSNTACAHSSPWTLNPISPSKGKECQEKERSGGPRGGGDWKEQGDRTLTHCLCSRKSKKQSLCLRPPPCPISQSPNGAQGSPCRQPTPGLAGAEKPSSRLRQEAHKHPRQLTLLMSTLASGACLLYTCALQVRPLNLLWLLPPWKPPADISR